MNVDLERVASWIKEHPWPGVGLAFLGGMALGLADALQRGTALAALRDIAVGRVAQSWTDYRTRPVGQA